MIVYTIRTHRTQNTICQYNYSMDQLYLLSRCIQQTSWNCCHVVFNRLAGIVVTLYSMDDYLYLLSRCIQYQLYLLSRCIQQTSCNCCHDVFNGLAVFVVTLYSMDDQLYLLSRCIQWTCCNCCHVVFNGRLVVIVVTLYSIQQCLLVQCVFSRITILDSVLC